MMPLHQASVSGIDFLTNVYFRSWPQALIALDQTSLYEALRLLDAIDRQDLKELLNSAKAMGGVVSLSRFAYSADVVLNRKLPANTPVEVLGSSEGAAFLAQPSPLYLLQDPTWTLPPNMCSQRALNEADYQRAAKTLGVEVAVVKTVATVESSGAMFGKDGRCIVRFELHKFAGFTSGQYNRTHPYLSNSASVGREKSRHHDQAQEWSYLYAAAVLRRTEEAIQSSSWGAFQIMGFNHAHAGYPTAATFASAMCASASNQLDAFLNFCTSAGLVKYLLKMDWVQFASHYNGPSYTVNNYDAHLAQAYQRFASASP